MKHQQKMPMPKLSRLTVFGIVLFLVIAMLLVAYHIRLTQINLPELPTIAALPSDTATIEVTASNTPTDIPTVTSSPSPTESDTPAPTDTQKVFPPSNEAQAIVTAPTGSDIAVTSPVNVSIRVKDKDGTQARSGPGISYDVVSQVNFATTYVVLAYAKDFFGYTWYLVELPIGKLAWLLAPATEIVAGTREAAQVALAVTIPPTPTLRPTLTVTPAGGVESQLQAVPIFSGVSSELRTIYLKGQSLGNHGNIFTKVGDCNSKSDVYLGSLDTGTYKLGRYASLQNTISYFKGSFNRNSAAAQIGFNVVTVQDSLWADPKACEGSESPLTCEYRLVQPSIALIMFGANDVLFLSPKLYQQYLRQIVEQSIADVIIPVLMTFTWHSNTDDALREKMLTFNMIDVNLAHDYSIPLINFWLASQYLPDHGISRDNAHVNWSVNGLDFTGDETRWGETLRSLLTLEMLHQIQTEIGP